jgi:hypothetical protein
MNDIKNDNCLTRTTHIKRALIGLSALAFLPLAACDMSADDQVIEAADTTDTPRDGEIIVSKTMLADVKLDDGPQLVFIDLADPGQKPQVGVYEFVATGHLGTADFAELANVSPLELFLAATDADTQVPERLLATDASTSDKLQNVQRGWLRDAVLSGQQAKGICTDSEFMAAVNAKGYNDRGTPSFRLNKTAGTSGYFAPQGYTWYPENVGANYYNHYTVGGNAGSVWSNIDRYYTRVAVCAIGSHPTLTNPSTGATVVHPGPTISVRYRDSNDNPYSYAIVLNHDYSSTGYSNWHFNSGSNWDWRTQIDHAADGDQFDIGHAVEDL